MKEKILKVLYLIVCIAISSLLLGLGFGRKSKQYVNLNKLERITYYSGKKK